MIRKCLFIMLLGLLLSACGSDNPVSPEGNTISYTVQTEGRAFDVTFNASDQVIRTETV